tara:strand:- start:258 stop:1541 length:1284 start_codon:yes stop_codon:yes gene_type:complete
MRGGGGVGERGAATASGVQMWVDLNSAVQLWVVQRGAAVGGAARFTAALCMRRWSDRVRVHGRDETMSGRTFTDDLFQPEAGMSLFTLASNNPRHVQAVATQLYLVRTNPTTMPSQNVIKSMSLEGGKTQTYASRVRNHVLELMRRSNSKQPTQNESCTLVCKLATMTQATYNEPDYYTSVDGLERRAIEDWEKVHGQTEHSMEATAKIPVVGMTKGQKGAATRKLKAAQRFVKQQRAEAKKNGKGVGKQRAGAVGRKPARGAVKKPLVGRGGQNGLGLDIPPPPSGDPPPEEGCSAQDVHRRSKKQAKVVADPHLAFEQSMSEVKSIWEEQQKLMQRMAHAIAACNENAELMQARVAEREAELQVQHEKKLAASKEKLQREARKAVLREMLRKMEENEESGEEDGEGNEGEDSDGEEHEGQAETGV